MQQFSQNKRTRSSTAFLQNLQKKIVQNMQMSNLSSAFLANEFAFSQRNFSRTVKDITGMNTTLFIRKMRMEKACELLRTTSMPIIEVSIKTGFESSNYFCRVFKKELGMTPGEYRNSSLNTEP